MKDLRLSGDRAYFAVCSFLKKEHKEYGWKELGPLLGSMSLVDGMPLDRALLKDWNEVLTKEFGKVTPDVAKGSLDEHQIYAAMFSFFKKLFVLGKNDLSMLIDDMSLIDGKPKDLVFVQLWEEAVYFAKRGGQADPVRLTKDGVTFDVHIK